ncbi:hypothetical protein ABMA10_05620 [Plantibacter sp. RU18]
MTLRRRTVLLVLWAVVLLLAVAQLVLAVVWLVRHGGLAEIVDVLRLALALAACVLAVLMLRIAVRDRSRALAEECTESAELPDSRAR